MARRLRRTPWTPAWSRAVLLRPKAVLRAVRLETGTADVDDVEVPARIARGDDRLVEVDQRRRSDAPPQADRIDHGVDALQRGGQTLLVVDFDAAQLVVLVLSIAGWWSTVPQVARMLCGPLSEEEHARRRTAVVRAARRLAAPGAPAPQDDNRINGS